MDDLTNVGTRRISAGHGPRHGVTTGDAFLRVASRSARIASHLQLFQLLQGDVQEFIPHRILICAWGDFFGQDVRFDVVSAIAGVRTERPAQCTIGSLLGALYQRWVARERRPLLLDCALPQMREFSGCSCALHRSLQTMHSVLVHGVHDARLGSDVLYVAMNTSAILPAVDVEEDRHIVDSIVAQIDIAFRGVSDLNRPAEDPLANPLALSRRELEILTWVSMGRTNAEVSRLLGISAFTVKNHMQRIIRKLGASNRTEAVAKYRLKKSAAHRQPGAPRRRRTDLMALAPFAE
jgi:transcriptional regulator EpsA